jgi:hypothetical protein
MDPFVDDLIKHPIFKPIIKDGKDDKAPSFTSVFLHTHMVSCTLIITARVCVYVRINRMIIA